MYTDIFHVDLQSADLQFTPHFPAHSLYRGNDTDGKRAINFDEHIVFIERCCNDGFDGDFVARFDACVESVADHTFHSELGVDHALCVLSRAAIVLERKTLALSLYERAYQYNRYCLPALMGIGELFYEDGQFERALSFFENVLEIEPTHPGAFKRMVQILQRTKNDAEQVLIRFEKIIKELLRGYSFESTLAHLEEDDKTLLAICESTIDFFTYILDNDPCNESALDALVRLCAPDSIVLSTYESSDTRVTPLEQLLTAFHIGDVSDVAENTHSVSTTSPSADFTSEPASVIGYVGVVVPSDDEDYFGPENKIILHRKEADGDELIVLRLKGYVSEPFSREVEREVARGDSNCYSSGDSSGDESMLRFIKILKDTLPNRVFLPQVAIVYLEKALAVDPNNRFALEKIIDIFWSSSDLDELDGLVYLQRALETNPTDEFALSSLVDIYRVCLGHATSDWRREVMPYLERALQEDPAHSYALRTLWDLVQYEDEYKMLTYVERALAKDPVNEFALDLLISLFRGYYPGLYRDFTKTMAYVERALAKDPVNDCALRLLVSICLGEYNKEYRDIAKALAYLAAALAKDPVNDYALRFLVSLCLGERTEEYKDVAKALAYLEAALAKDPVNEYAIVELFNICNGFYSEEYKDVAKALAYLEAALAKDPINSFALSALFNLCCGACRAEYKDVAKALIYVEAALAKDPTNAFALRGLMAICHGKYSKEYRDRSKALVYIEAALSQDPLNTFALQELIKEFTGKSTDLLKLMSCLGRALEMDPNNRQALQMIARLYIKGEHGVAADPAQAVPYLKKAVENDPKDHYSIACLTLLFLQGKLAGYRSNHFFISDVRRYLVERQSQQPEDRLPTHMLVCLDEFEAQSVIGACHQLQNYLYS